jgi:hypothetical protein
MRELKAAVHRWLLPLVAALCVLARGFFGGQPRVIKPRGSTIAVKSLSRRPFFPFSPLLSVVV